jgi:hypothetical protein
MLTLAGGLGLLWAMPPAWADLPAMVAKIKPSIVAVGTYMAAPC